MYKCIDTDMQIIQIIQIQIQIQISLSLCIYTYSIALLGWWWREVTSWGRGGGGLCEPHSFFDIVCGANLPLRRLLEVR
jgi:hypothetical protein